MLVIGSIAVFGGSAAQAADPPYNIPAPPAYPVYKIPLPQVPLVAALTMPRHQTLRHVLARGLVANLYAYRPVRLRLAVLLPAKTARRVGLAKRRPVASRLVQVDKPGVYRLRVFFKHRARARMRHLRRAAIYLRSTLATAEAKSTSTSRVALAAR